MAKMFKGIMPAIFSVYDTDGNVLNNTVRELVDYQLSNGVTGFYVGGNTGECTILPAKTRKQMLESVITANAGRGQIIAHIGAGHLDETLDLLEHANEQTIDAVASLPPSLSGYYRMNEIIEYYKLIASRSKHPVLSYITSVLSGDLYAFAEKLIEIDNIVGIKFSVPDYYTFGRIKEAFGDTAYLINGPDETLICGLAQGADAAIGTSYNILPKLAVSIYESFTNGKTGEALDAQRKLNHFISILIPEDIAFWKASLSLLGFDMGYTFDPQHMPTDEELEDLRNKLTEINFFNLI